jgi:hypothetical protein
MYFYIVFIPTVWFRRERHEAIFCVDIRWLFGPWWSQKKEYHEGRIGGLAKGGSSLRDVDEFAWRSELRNSGMHVWATSQVKFGVLPLRVKIQGLA